MQEAVAGHDVVNPRSILGHGFLLDFFQHLASRCALRRFGFQDTGRTDEKKGCSRGHRRAPRARTSGPRLRFG
jgi:hypothetical protein